VKRRDNFYTKEAALIVTGLAEAGPITGVSDPGYTVNPASCRPEQPRFAL
jgi:hypothetical protein